MKRPNNAEPNGARGHGGFSTAEVVLQPDVSEDGSGRRADGWGLWIPGSDVRSDLPHATSPLLAIMTLHLAKHVG